MKKSWLLAATVAATGCLPENHPDLVSDIGTSFFFGDVGSNWTLERVNNQEHMLLQGLASQSERYPPDRIRQILSSLYVFLAADKFQCESSKTGFCNGTGWGNLVTVRDLGCPYNSAYTHEVGHLLQEQIQHFIDYDHNETSLWQVADARAGDCP